MRHLYFDVQGWGSINVVDLSWAFKAPTHIIQGVEVNARRIQGRGGRSRGTARELMRQVLDDADREGVTLILSVTHITEEHNGGLSHQQLREWYGRLGFVPWDDTDADGMIRYPRVDGIAQVDHVSDTKLS